MEFGTYKQPREGRLLLWAAQLQYSFSRDPWVDFCFEQTGFDRRIVLHQLGSLLSVRAENHDSPVALPDRRAETAGHWPSLLQSSFQPKQDVAS